MWSIKLTGSFAICISMDSIDMQHWDTMWWKNEGWPHQCNGDRDDDETAKRERNAQNEWEVRQWQAERKRESEIERAAGRQGELGETEHRVQVEYEIFMGI